MLASDVLQAGVVRVVTGELDLLTTHSGIVLPLPPPAAGAPSMLIGCVSRIALTARTGTATGSATYRLGNNVTHDNFVPSTALAAATVNAAVNSVISLAMPIGYVARTPSLTFDLTAALTGATVLKGRFLFSLFYA